jgi:hypothetical protein
MASICGPTCHRHAARAFAQFAGLKQPSPSLARSLDVGATFKLASLKASEIDAMRTALDM